MVAVLGEIHRGCPLPGQQPACLARLGPGAGVCGCGSCPAQPGGATRLAAESTQSLQIRTGDRPDARIKACLIRGTVTRSAPWLRWRRMR